jgi:hypothetical protein
MAAATVLYVLNQGGNLNQQLPQTTAKLEALRAKAVQTTAATKQLGTSIPLPSFEKFTAVATGAAIATAALMNHAVALEKEMRAMGIDTGKAAAALGGYEQATNRLSAALQQLELTAATAMSGDLGRFVDMMTGAVLLTERLIDKFGGLASGLRDIGLAATEMLANMGPALGPLSAIAGIISGGATFAGVLGTAGSGAPGTPYNGPIYGPEWPGAGGGGGSTGTRSAAPAYQNRVGSISGVSGRPTFDPAAISWFDRLADSLRTTVTAMDPLPGALDQFSAAVEEGFRRVQRNSTIEGATSVASAFGSGDLGNLVGSTAMLAGAGPVGALIGTLVSIGPNLDELNQSLTDQLMNLIPQLTESLVNMMMVNSQNLARQLPELAGQIGEAIPVLIGALIAAAPGILIAALSGVITLPAAFIKGIGDGITQASAAFPDMLLQSWLGAWRAIKQEVREIFTGDGTGTQRARDFFGADANRFSYGYNSAAGQLSRGGGARSTNVNMGGVTVVAPDVRRFNEEMRRSLGTHGYGLTLDPLVRP